MQIYLVGGAVRDRLLGLPASDRDWVVVGATPNDLIKLGFQQVGKNFPVFLHPKTREEYALARTERKTGIGYTGFSCYTAPNVTIEEDLLRRDLTINAIAQTMDGKLIDPFNGKQDIKNHTLRHISDAFAEDPLRILRVARFAAKLATKKFTIAHETQSIIKKMIFNHDLDTIKTERVWWETEKVLQSTSPEVYFYILRRYGVLDILFFEISQLFSMYPTKKLKFPIDTGTHALLALKRAASLTNDTAVRFAALCHNIGKILLPNKQNFKHNNYKNSTNELIETMCNRLHISNKLKELAKLVAHFHRQVHQINLLQPKNIIKLFDQLDSWRKPERINQLAIACEADARGWIDKESSIYPQAKFLTEAFKIAKAISSKNLLKEGIKGVEIKNELNRQRICILTHWRQQQTILPILK